MFKKIIATICAMAMLTIGATASFAQDNSTIAENTKDEFYYEVDFTKLNIKSEEIEKMTMGEYLSKFFPEAWESLNEDEKSVQNETPFLENEKSRATVPSIKYVGTSTLSTNALTKYLTATARSTRTGDLKATSITHYMYIDDSKGNAVAGSISSKKSDTYTSKLTKPKATNVSGLKYRARTKHEWVVKNITYTSTSTSTFMDVK